MTFLSVFYDYVNTKQLDIIVRLFPFKLMLLFAHVFILFLSLALYTKVNLCTIYVLRNLF